MSSLLLHMDDGMPRPNCSHLLANIIEYISVIFKKDIDQESGHFMKNLGVELYIAVHG